VIGCGVLFLLANGVRQLGRKKEQQLFTEWGAIPTTQWLRHCDQNLDPVTKARYHAFLMSKIVGLALPTAEGEKGNKEAADDQYRSATKWLLEQTRDTRRFALLFNENINYGFQRNTLALKPIGVAISVAALLVTLWVGNIRLGTAEFSDTSVVVSFGAAVLAFILWIPVVTPAWVKDAANAYARAFLASCDSLAKSASDRAIPVRSRRGKKVK
jgi:hypothetical protein